jgi:putative N6-adenine-specific DNA methylase
MTSKTFFGLEGALAHELKALGAKKIDAHRRAISFTGDTAMLYRANLRLHTAIRILKPIHTFEARDEKGLYDGVRQIEWSRYLDKKDTLAVDAAVASKIFRHSKYAALKTKDAIVDQFRDRTGKRPSVDVENPRLRINLFIHNTEVTVSLDSSGESLHKRGWRIAMEQAPLNEILAAGLVLISGWDGTTTLLDPMCGSGTILVEAGLIASHIAPGFFRSSFGFMQWPDFDSALWKRMKEEATASITRPPCRIYGSDISGKAVAIARKNVAHAGLSDIIELSQKKFEERTAPDSGGTLIMNPPYGERMGPEDPRAFYRMIGGQLKHAYAGWDAWILAAKNEYLQYIGLRPSRKFELFNGDIECRYQKFELYKGRKAVEGKDHGQDQALALT